MKNINKNKKIIYSIIFIVFIAKIISLNTDKINDLYVYTRYELAIKNYNKLLSYQQFLEKKQKIQGIYFGSPQCPHCVRNIKSVKSITEDNNKIYYFEVKFDDYDNQVNFSKFKKKFKFETIPHIVLFKDDREKQYSSRSIAERNK